MQPNSKRLPEYIAKSESQESFTFGVDCSTAGAGSASWVVGSESSVGLGSSLFGSSDLDSSAGDGAAGAGAGSSGLASSSAGAGVSVDSGLASSVGLASAGDSSGLDSDEACSGSAGFSSDLDSSAGFSDGASSAGFSDGASSLVSTFAGGVGSSDFDSDAGGFCSPFWNQTKW